MLCACLGGWEVRRGGTGTPPTPLSSFRLEISCNRENNTVYSTVQYRERISVIVLYLSHKLSLRNQ